MAKGNLPRGNATVESPSDPVPEVRPSKGHRTFAEAVKFTETDPDEVDRPADAPVPGLGAVPSAPEASAEAPTMEEALKAQREAGENEIPDWVDIPEDLVFPKGRQVCFIRFRAAWTDTPEKGDRQCILWNLTGNDERLAIQRAGGDGMQVLHEMSKQMIRAVDGQRADWTKGPVRGAGSVTTFWNDVGVKCRKLIQNYYMRTHQLSEEEQMDFFANCIGVRSTVLATNRAG